MKSNFPIVARKTSSLLLIIFLLSSCKCNREKNHLKVFRYNQPEGLESLDPAFANNQAKWWACAQIYNGLVQLDDSLNVIPCIAKRWEISSDGLVYQFHLRDDVYFHDDKLFPPSTRGKGRKVTAKDFEYSFYRIIDSDVASKGAWVFKDKVVIPHKHEGKEYWTGKQPFVAVDDSTFEIYLRAPFPPFLQILTMPYGYVVPKEIVEHYGKDFRSHPVGTGPFRFKSWQEGVNLILVKNKNYFECDEKGNRLPYLDGVNISFINSKQTAFYEFLKGNYDFHSGVDPSFKDELLTKDGNLNPKHADRIVMSKSPYLNTEYLGMLIDEKNPRVQSSPLKNKKVRQAINYAIDRKKMLTYLRNGIGIPATHGIIPVGLPDYNSENVKDYDYNPDLAKKLLTEAGYPNGFNGIKLLTNQSYREFSEFIQKELGEIGIKISVEVNDFGAHQEMVYNGKADFWRASWIGDYADPENFLALFYSKNFSPAGPNTTHFKNEKYDLLYEKALSEPDAKKRNAYYNEMEKIMLEEAPCVFLYYDEAIRLWQKNVEGLGSNAMNLLSLKRVRIE